MKLFQKRFQLVFRKGSAIQYTIIQKQVRCPSYYLWPLRKYILHLKIYFATTSLKYNKL